MSHASPSVGPRLPCLRCSSAAQSGFDRLSWARCAEATREDVAVVSKSVGRWLSVFNTRVVWLCDWRKHLRLTNERPDSQPCYWCWHQFSPGFFFFFFSIHPKRQSSFYVAQNVQIMFFYTSVYDGSSFFSVSAGRPHASASFPVFSWRGIWHIIVIKGMNEVQRGQMSNVIL